MKSCGTCEHWENPYYSGFDFGDCQIPLWIVPAVVETQTTSANEGSECPLWKEKK